MRSTNRYGLIVPAWMVSLGLHGGLVWLAVLFAAQVKPVLNDEIFEWDVALVEAVNTPAPSSQAAPDPMPPPRTAARRSAEPSDTVVHRVAPLQTVQMVHPDVTPSTPVEQREEPVQPMKSEPVTPVKPVPEKTIASADQPFLEASKQPTQPVTASKEADLTDPVMAQRQPKEAAESRELDAALKPSTAEMPVSSSPVEPAPAVSDAPMQTAKAATGPDVKTDHRWLAESLWRRVAELKRYPSSARLNGQEGKVIVKAVIRSDGHLAEVSVQKSSGHTILDTAAIESVKLACPLEMKHAINKSEIVVSLPIVYSLAD